ncbi:uncharacterized protein TNCT_663991 [Trichonephila clavata]|uniref:DUF7041 domain-containing protein n=1 Tax=Trichonephila clavata TaxID=2740835 RepID=A0A8X6ILL4_TRICU|nr:uncharacterized protein TNCT_663991 [Trichonephila clavata]
MQIEAYFRNSKIAADQSKYDIVMSTIEAEIISQTSDIVINPPANDKYDTIKNRLISVFADSGTQKLLTDLELGDKKPSQLFCEMRNLSDEKDHFEPVTRARVIQLLDEFFGTRYQPGEDVGIFISRVKTAATRLQEAGHKLDDLYIGFQLIRWLPQEFQSTVQQIYRWKEDFTAVKIEAELILEANRHQLMKQDLEKTETVYFSNFLSKKLSKFLEILDLNFPDYDEEDDFDTVRDSLSSRLVSKTSTETPTTSFEKPDLSSDNRSLIPCSEVKWIRNIGREVTGSNVYYGIAKGQQPV